MYGLLELKTGRRLEVAETWFLSYVAEEGRRRRVTSRGEGVGKANIRKKEKLVGTPTEVAIRKSSQANSVLSTDM
jgi:hypothetical protein